MDELGPLERPPGKVQAIGILHLIAGVLNLLGAIGWAIYGALFTLGTFGLGFFTCCPVFVLLPLGVVELVSGIRHLSSDHRGLGAPKMTGIVQLFGILGCGVISTVSGILTLAFLSDPEVAAYYARKQLAG
jgi:hypothetical protein